jgi:hypothetical protein
MTNRKPWIDEWGNVLAIAYVLGLILGSLFFSAMLGANEYHNSTGEYVSTWDYLTGNFNKSR